MNLPNQLTLSRIGMVPLMVFGLLAYKISEAQGWVTLNLWLALIVFIIASITDAVDGHLARKHNLVTNFGRLMDPLADKLLVISAFVGLMELNVFSPWLVIIVLCREFLVTGLRTLGVAQNRVIQADKWGKNKTITQITAIITAMVLLSFENTFVYFSLFQFQAGAAPAWWNWLREITLYALTAAVLFTTLVSGFLYMSQNRDLLSEN
ncbi:CDP-diacylglycerol--glycerol-3-phosphate 3-phosphatidyltransferase [Candidatus Sumerlaeota bacterium]|nr:CDP-diacylglycerol--glycerol-3-phosphate 3-phosphatidyltransferase [Candidatus Sumerlaeota bacterium]